jgi:Fe-S-cluster containining protein
VKLDRFGEPARPPATRVDDWYRILRGRCVFFDGSGCGIYAARPGECERYVCTNEPAENLSNAAIARMWRAGGAAE